MRLAILGVLSALMSFAVITGAGATDDKKRKAQKHAASAPAATAPRPERYRELLADKMRVGSSEWWEQMRREGRLGGETP